MYLTSKATGTISDYPLTAGTGSYWSQYFTGPSFSASASGADMTGGVNAVYSGADVLNETYTVDPWGNQQESGNFNFSQSFNPATNQVNGYSYDAAGDLLNDGMNNYTYDGEGMLTSAGGAQYTYDALQQRVDKTGGSNPEEIIYFDGRPVALYNPSSGVWTDLIWAGNNIIAEVPGSQTAAPVYRLLDHEGSLIATTDSSGNINSSNLIAPYGQLMASNTSDPYLYAGLYQDTEYGGHDAWYRNYSAEQSRWLRPDPYNGSYDLMNPQSFNRYMYVNGNPLGFSDPSGLALGIVNGVGGSACKAVGDIFNASLPEINPCNPIGSLIAIGITGIIGDMSLYGSAGFTIGDWSISSGALGGPVTASQVAPFVAAAFTIACSIDYNSAACGPKGWTSDVIGGNAGKVIGDSIAVTGDALIYEFGPACAAAAGSPADPACDVVYAVAIYTVFNDLFSLFWGPPQFKGSLLPRPSDMGGLGTSPIGIPIRT